MKRIRKPSNPAFCHLTLAKLSANNAASQVQQSATKSAANGLISRQALRHLRRAADCLTLLLPVAILHPQPLPLMPEKAPLQAAADATITAIRSVESANTASFTSEDIKLYEDAKVNLKLALAAIKLISS